MTDLALLHAPSAIDLHDAKSADTKPDTWMLSASHKDAPSSASLAIPAALDELLGVMQHVAAVLAQAINDRRWSWNKLVYLGERHAVALSYVDMLRGYQKASAAALHYLDTDLRDLLQVPNFATQIRASLHGKAQLAAALHFLHGLDADLQRG